MATEDSVTLTHTDDSGQTVTPDNFIFSIVNKFDGLYGFAAPVEETRSLINLFSTFTFFKKHHVEIQKKTCPNLLELDKNLRAESISEYNFLISTVKKNLSDINQEIQTVPTSDTKRRVPLYSVSNDTIRLLRDLEERKHALEIRPLLESEISSLIDAAIRERMEAEAA